MLTEDEMMYVVLDATVFGGLEGTASAVRAHSPATVTVNAAVVVVKPYNLLVIFTLRTKAPLLFRGLYDMSNVFGGPAADSVKVIHERAKSAPVLPSSSLNSRSPHLSLVADSSFGSSNYCTASS